MSPYQKRGNAALFGLALVATVAMGALPHPAYAEHGQVTRGVLLGLAAGYVGSQILNHKNTPAGSTAQPVITPPPAAAPTYSAPAYSANSPDSIVFRNEDRQVRMAIQYHLMQDGFYRGSIDGIWGPATESAVYQYANAHNEVGNLVSKAASRQVFADILNSHPATNTNGG
ncbi:peptidoglycan-binding domain-containing protein [Solirhodobacter olei]|uniref:peptidoglycan-binding domain-containing protein n=1 Tax=Solirhodobacter olei TaxID=2493082 RepID=UPI000FDB4FD9|nr:peptidoglycan-binding domain-containing protein [Solirhodobacter olei]